MGRVVRRVAGAVGTCVVLAGLAACADTAAERSAETPRSDATTPATTVSPAVPDMSVDPPPELDQPLQPADMLVYSRRTLSDEMVQRIQSLEQVAATERLSMANVAVEDRVFTVAAVDPASYRRFTPVGTAQAEEIWARVAGGELAITERLGRRLQDEDSYVVLGNDEDAPRVHIGAYADQGPQVDAVVNRRWAQELGMIPDNALLISTGMNSPTEVRKPVERIVGSEASVQNLDVVARLGLDIDAQQTAFLTGGSVAEAVGSFNYRVLGGGRIAPDPGWVAANIRTERVPILGAVTCHRVMLPQLRAALEEVVERGLADTIHPEEYAGCYYPRFIAGSTQLSLHSFGIAVDLNVPGNQRGTPGEIDRTVVSIFKKWGFAWGGDWSWTDPMHFEMNAIVQPR